MLSPQEAFLAYTVAIDTTNYTGDSQYTGKKIFTLLVDK